ncbi:signal peptidase I [Miniphocaeibacter massiliensis]|uniref:signal peptidase I n=1 Tax=Miniphocaeibacter massiliensis TaxID=2041841 RepID=UPI000C07ACE0|nr:signal peptidase I [Miniphocaeibacter massiliensis]
MDNEEKNSKNLNSIKTILVVLVLVILVKLFVIDFTLVDGKSMYPTLNHNDRLLVNKLSFFKNDLEYGDIIIFESPIEENKNYIKRVIGKEGDSIEIKDNKIYVNDKIVKEDYTSTNGYTKYSDISQWKIESGEIFVLGDNRPESNDSRTFGPISRDSIKGIAFFRFYPFNNIGGI